MIAMWKLQKTVRGGRAQGGDGNSTVLDDDDSGEADKKVCNKTRVNYKKTLPAVGFNSPPPQAPKCLFQQEEHGLAPYASYVRGSPPHHHGSRNYTLKFYYNHNTRQHSLPPPRRGRGGLWWSARALSECTGVDKANSAVGLSIN
jgi:hypothetical protein